MGILWLCWKVVRFFEHCCGGDMASTGVGRRWLRVEVLINLVKQVRPIATANDHSYAMAA